MDHRPVQALLGVDGSRLSALLDDALHGRGPALLPIAADTPAPLVDRLLRTLRPATLRTPEGVTTCPGPAEGVGEDTALVLTTSGSTGAPKGVELSAAALLHSADASLRRLGAVDGDWLCVLPTSHIAGIQVLLRALAAETAAIQCRFDVDTVVEAAAEHRPHVSLVPTQLRRLLDAGADLSGFRTILLGGAPATGDLLAAARRAGGRVVTSYGMSETCGGCVYDGLPLDGVQVAIGPDGRIQLGGAVVATGYRLRPDLTSEHLRTAAGTRWFTTSDLGVWEAGGRLRVRGRTDDVIITGGYNVDSREVAEVLQRHPAVAEAVVVGRPDRDWGQRVAAIIVPADSRRPPGLEELRAWTRQRLPHYAAPHELDLRQALPLLASGKPDLAALRQPDVGTLRLAGTSK